MKEIHGTARISEDRRILTIITPAKRGKKIVENKQTYLVEDVRPDPRVCSPAFKLTKGNVFTNAADMTPAGLESGAKEELIPSENGEVWHVQQNEYGVMCDCPHATFRGANSREPCKHTKAMIAVGFFPGERIHEVIGSDGSEDTGNVGNRSQDGETAQVPCQANGDGWD